MGDDDSVPVSTVRPYMSLCLSLSLSPLCLHFDVMLTRPFYLRGIYKDMGEKSCLTMHGCGGIEPVNLYNRVDLPKVPTKTFFYPLHVHVFSYAHFRSEISSQTKQFSNTSEKAV